MRKKDFTKDNKIEILKFICQIQFEELNFRREREYRVFTWASSVLFALIGALLIYKQNTQELLTFYGITGKIIVSITVLLLILFSVSWLNRNRKYRGQNAKVIANISKILHCYDEGFYDPENNTALFPTEWESYGGRHMMFASRFLRANYATATFFIGILAILMIWLS